MDAAVASTASLTGSLLIVCCNLIRIGVQAHGEARRLLYAKWMYQVIRLGSLVMCSARLPLHKNSSKKSGITVLIGASLGLLLFFEKCISDENSAPMSTLAAIHMQKKESIHSSQST